MLRVSLLGNLGADPESRWNNKGTTVTVFRVAVNQIRKGPDGERQENTEWFRVRTFGHMAEYAARFTKGTRVYATGRLEVTYYTTRNGEKRAGFEVLGDEVVAFGPLKPATLDAAAPGEPQAEDEPEPVGAGAALGVSSLAGASNGAHAASERRTEELEDLPF